MQYRWHITLKKLSLMNNNMANRCWKCGVMEGTYFHMWWTCSRAKEFWGKIHPKLIKLLGYTFEKRPELNLISLKLEFFPKENRILLGYAQKWRVSEIPTVEVWLIKLFDFIELDYLMRILENQDMPRYKMSRKKLKMYMESNMKIFV